jgi:hypothetical protein
VANLLYVFRYFQVVPPIPALMTGAFAVITVVGMLSIALSVNGGATAAVPVVVLQAFGSSTGFSAPARRGYFDLLLSRGEPRTRIALVQWLTAIAPGLTSWAMLALAYTLSRPAAENPLLASGTVVALIMASTIPWAVTVSLPRFSGAIGWLLLVSLGATGGAVWPDPVRAVVFPIDVVGERVGNRVDILLPALLLSIASVAIALWWVHRTDIRLESAQ